MDRKLVDKLERYAIDYTYYKVHCDFCDAETEECEYPSSAAEEAAGLGFNTYKWSGGSEGIACKECLLKEEWKK